MRIAVDVCIGRRGVAMLTAAGCEVLEAQPGEAERDWFARAIAWGVELVVSPDQDLAILCYDQRVAFSRAKRGHKGHVTAAAVVAALSRHRSIYRELRRR